MLHHDGGATGICGNFTARIVRRISAKSVTERTEAKLTFRLKYKTKDGDRQISNSYIVSLFP